MNWLSMRVVSPKWASDLKPQVRKQADYWQVGPVAVVSFSWVDLYKQWLDMAQKAFDHSKFAYIDRSTPFGNPYRIGVDGDRNTVLVKFRTHLLSSEQLIADAGSSLRGMHLICHCAPKPCHGLYLASVANH